MKKPSKHTIETLTAALRTKSIDYVAVVDIKENRVEVRDNHYGLYAVDLKSFCDSTAFPLHKARRHAQKIQEAGKKLLGKSFGGYVIEGLFYGPDRGYKNRSFYVEATAPCGHLVITTAAHLKKHRAPDSECRTCSKITHGARGQKDGERIKRTPTYIHWQRIRATLPDFLCQFEDFRRILGDKPYARAEIIVFDRTARWVPLVAVEDKETNLIATAMRQAFRHSEIYRAALEAARVETADGTRYRCASCGELAKKSQVQIDHIDPIQPLDGRPLRREELLHRIWTDKVQVLDRVCHSQKSTGENKARKKAKCGQDDKKS